MLNLYLAYIFCTIGFLMILSSLPLMVIFKHDEFYKDISRIVLVVGFLLFCICGFWILTNRYL